jgi:hypothetical protein
MYTLGNILWLVGLIGFLISAAFSPNEYVFYIKHEILKMSLTKKNNLIAIKKREAITHLLMILFASIWIISSMFLSLKP